MSDSPAPRRNPIRRVLGKGRRGIRKALMGNSGAVGQEQLNDLWHWVNGLQTLVNSTSNRVDDAVSRLDRGLRENGEHMDLVIDQLWRRLEAADARLATQLQILSETSGRQIADLETLTSRLRIENAAILRIVGHEELISTGPIEVEPSTLPISRMTLFSEIERGSSDVLLEKLKQYVPYYTDAKGPIADLGCGKGDFLELLSEAGTKAYGIDLDEDQVRLATDRNLDARLEDIFKHLESLSDNSLGGVFSSQVVEHLPAELVPQLYEELFRVVMSGGRVIFETPNPATFATHVQSFWRDPTHIRPVPVSALDFSARSAGFINEQTVFTSPSPDAERLARLEIEPKDPLLSELVRRFNQNAEKLDDLLFGYQDYALVVRKP